MSPNKSTPIRNSIFLNPDRFRLKIILLCILLLVLFLVDLILGSTLIPLKEVFFSLFNPSSAKPEYHSIIMGFRFPKAIVAILAGMALSVSGLQMQTVFRNPMAGPFVLGISSGAGLFVAVLLMGISSFPAFSILSGLQDLTIAMAAWTGAFLVLATILMVSSRVKDIMTILILGIMIGAGASAVISILQYFSADVALKSYVVWSLGSLGNLTTNQLIILSISTLIGLVLSLFQFRPLNALLLGEEHSRGLGIKVKTVRIVLFTSTSILAGTVTAFCGPLGFIGIAVPHISRMIVKSVRHEYLLPFTAICGGAVMLFCDLLSQIPGSDKVLPINAITSLIGIPFVIWIVLKNQKTFV